MFKRMKSDPTEMKLLKFLIFLKNLYLVKYIGKNTIIKPSNKERKAIQNQFPWVYIQHIPKSKYRANKIETGISINLCFLSI